MLQDRSIVKKIVNQMAEEYKAERMITAVLKEEKQVDNVVRRLIDRGVPQDHISLMGQNFESQTRIAALFLKKMSS